MKKLIYLLFVVSFISCKQKPWNKEYLLDKCKTQMGKDEKVNGVLTAEQQAAVCECSVDKVLAKYKTKAEADKNKADVDALGNECAAAILMPKEDTTNTTMDTNNMTDTTTMNPVDSTDHQ
jgi:hypothetical protein